MIVAAYPGTGKTRLATMYPEVVMDAKHSHYKYYLEDENYERHENATFHLTKTIREDWPYNYVKALICATNSGKILLIFPNNDILNM